MYTFLENIGIEFVNNIPSFAKRVHFFYIRILRHPYKFAVVIAKIFATFEKYGYYHVLRKARIKVDVSSR